MWDCAVIGCPNSRFNAQKTRPRISFHVFPHPVRESNRFRRWLALINNPRLFRLDPLNVFKSVRVCRRHFGPDCFNGVCRNLLPTAIPTLNLPEVRPVALVQPMDAMGDELERLLRDERRQQLKRHGAVEPPFGGEEDESGKRQKIGITLLSADCEDVECNLGDRFIDRIISFDAEQEYGDGPLAGESYGLSSFSGMVVKASELETLNQVEILNEPPETLLNDSPTARDHVRMSNEKGREQLVQESTSETSNEDQETEQHSLLTETSGTKTEGKTSLADDANKRTTVLAYPKGLQLAERV